MLIRSQNRELLLNLNADSIIINHVGSTQTKTVKIVSADEHGWILGEYPLTRAIEVMDEIQEAYLGCNRRDNKYMPTINTGVPQSSWIENTAFQMPEK